MHRGEDLLPMMQMERSLWIIVYHIMRINNSTPCYFYSQIPARDVWNREKMCEWKEKSAGNMNKKRLGNNNAGGLSRNLHFQTRFSLFFFRVQVIQHLGWILMWFICMLIRSELSDDFRLRLIQTCLLANCYIHHVLFILPIITYFIQKATSIIHF